MVAQMVVRPGAGIDWRRVVAMAAVMLMHAVLLAVILQPRPAPEFERRVLPPETAAVDWIEPPPLPPLPVQPVPPAPLPLQPYTAPTVREPAPAQPAEIQIATSTAPDPFPAQESPVAPVSSGAGNEIGLAGSAPALESLAYRHAPPPGYPYRSLARGHEGTVQLRVLVSSAGLPERIEIEQSSGHRELDQAAIRAVRGWRFVPAVLDGQARSAWALVPVDFRLRGN